jgi:spoIIIJ-associated protein
MSEPDETESRQASNEIAPETLSESERSALAIVEEICRLSRLQMRPVVRESHSTYLNIELVGEDAGLAFGKGANLDALQYLSNLIVMRQVNGDVRLVLDAGNYRAKREAALRKLALEYAAQVKERQEECEIDPLPPHERRIIHNALLDDPEIRTYSEGEEPNRRIIIAPR